MHPPMRRRPMLRPHRWYGTAADSGLDRAASARCAVSSATMGDAAFVIGRAEPRDLPAVGRLGFRTTMLEMTREITP